MQCEYCQSEFVQIKKNQRFYSENCYRSNYKKSATEQLAKLRCETIKLCLVCGEKFVPNIRINEKYCSSICRNRRIKNIYKGPPSDFMECHYCGKVFTPIRCDAKWCSYECKNEAYKIRIRKKYAKQKELLTSRNCDYCKKEFTPLRWRDRGQRFCCQICANEFTKSQSRTQTEQHRQTVIKRCPICEKEFTPIKTLKQKYCSKRCCYYIPKKIYKALQSCYDAIGTKKHDHSRTILGYSPQQLLERLQTFPQWEQLKMGSWHLDHIFPIKAFLDHGIKDVKRICALDNLQPLVGPDNMVKSDNYDNALFEEYLKK